MIKTEIAMIIVTATCTDPDASSTDVVTIAYVLIPNISKCITGANTLIHNVIEVTTFGRSLS